MPQLRYCIGRPFDLELHLVIKGLIVCALCKVAEFHTVIELYFFDISVNILFLYKRCFLRVFNVFCKAAQVTAVVFPHVRAQCGLTF